MLKQLLDLLKGLIEKTPTSTGIAILTTLILIAIIIPNLEKILNAYEKIKSAVKQFDKVSDLQRSIDLQKAIIIEKARLLREENKKIENTIQSLETNVTTLNQPVINQQKKPSQVTVLAKIENDINSLKNHLAVLKKIAESNNDIEELAVLNIDNKERAERMAARANQREKRKNIRRQD